MTGFSGTRRMAALLACLGAFLLTYAAIAALTPRTSKALGERNALLLIQGSACETSGSCWIELWNSHGQSWVRMNHYEPIQTGDCVSVIRSVAEQMRVCNPVGCARATYEGTGECQRVIQ